MNEQLSPAWVKVIAGLMVALPVALVWVLGRVRREVDRPRHFAADLERDPDDGR